MNKKTKCSNCSNQKRTVVYEGKIRDGVFGSFTEYETKVVKCSKCNLIRLDENPYSIETYKSEEYRDSYMESHDPKDYIDNLDYEQPPRLVTIGMKNCRDKVILDHGCGAGSLLDILKGPSKKTIGIEPFTGYHKSIRSRGHEVFSNAEKAKKKYSGKVDLISSFGVLEHTEDPLIYLKDSLTLLKKGGKMFIETDNNDDILKKLIPDDFNPFFYRTAHLWYFDKNTLKEICKLAGFKINKIYFRHNFDLSNTLAWIKEKKPTGNNFFNLFDENFTKSWKSYIEKEGLSDLVCAEIEKK
jgi:SAM-dependent methyltransferase